MKYLATLCPKCQLLEMNYLLTLTINQMGEFYKTECQVKVASPPPSHFLKPLSSDLLNECRKILSYLIGKLFSYAVDDPFVMRKHQELLSSALQHV